MVHGYCFGGGTRLVSACDFAIAAEEALFGIPAVNFGGLPGGMVSKGPSGDVLAYRDALYYALTCEPFDGKRAQPVSREPRRARRPSLEARDLRAGAQARGDGPRGAALSPRRRC